LYAFISGHFYCLVLTTKKLFDLTSVWTFLLENKVCQRPKTGRTYKKRTGTTNEQEAIYPTLKPGERFITKFGVVEVVKDDRATPTAKYPSDFQQQQRLYTNKYHKFLKKKTRRYVANAITMRARRSHINGVYETHRRQRIQESFHEPVVDGRSIAKAYFVGAEPGNFSPVGNGVSDTPVMPEDPTVPPESFPDRIVECIGVPDTRKHFVSVSSEPKSGTNSADPAQPPKLFLQRRLLVEPYLETESGYSCVECGQTFGSVPGISYHERSSVCRNHSSRKAQKRQETERKIEDGVSKLVAKSKKPPLVPADDDDDDGDIQQMYIDRPKKVEESRTTHYERRRMRVMKKKVLGVYPEILVSLGFTLKKKGKDAEKIIEEALDLKGVKGSSEEEKKSSTGKKPNDGGEGKLENPRETLDDLLRQLQYEKRMENDLNIGGVYDEVYQSLGFRPYTPPAPLMPKEKQQRNRKDRRVIEKEDAPIPPTVDVRALFDEVESGRYPSMKFYDGQHAENCIACKETFGTLFECSYCEHVEHIGCIRERFLVKTPEPDEPVFCHICLGAIISRRNRAEKRRVGKSMQPPGKQSAAANDAYSILSQKGQEVSELSELLRDAEERLQQLLATQKIDRMRYRMIDNGS
jgi:hypothetical protein